MKTITSFYNRICKQRYVPLGFYKGKPAFVRKSGDVLHAFALKRYYGTPICSVEFGIFPLCLPQPVFFFAGGYLLDEFIVELSKDSAGWLFDPKSEESMANCAESISEAIDLYLMPFFELCSDCKSALPELIKLEDLFEQNRKKVLYLMNETDRSWLKGQSMFDSRKFYMALKAEDFSYAKQYLQFQVEFCEKKLKSFAEPGAPTQPDAVKQSFWAKQALCLEQLKRIDMEDFGYFDALLKSNEEQMLKLLTEQYPKLAL